MRIQRAKRFWKQALVIELTADEGFGVTLDSCPVRVSSKRPLRLKTRALAEAVAAEWRSREKTIDFRSMPLTRLANTAQDRIAPLREQVLAGLLKHVDGDTLCYYADQPQDLIERQHAAWTPVLVWAGKVFGASWKTAAGVMPLTQGAAVHRAVALALAGLGNEEVAAFQVIAPATGSILIGLATVHGRLNARQAFAVASVDELYQAEKWGEDREAADRRKRLEGELAAAERYLALNRTGTPTPE